MSETYVLGIPVKSASINVLQVHPEIRYRVRNALFDDNLRTLARMSSGARSYALQKTLYARYKAGKGPLAANPDYHNPKTGRKGSAHQVQDPGGYRRSGLDNSRPWAYAVDVGFYGAVQSKKLRATMLKYGMVANLWHVGEWWHYVPADGIQAQVLSGHGMFGDTVKAVQRKLGITADGWHGPATTKAVADAQHAVGHARTGDWTRDNDTAHTHAVRTKQTATDKQTTAAKTKTDRQTLQQIGRIVDKQLKE